MSDLCRLIWYTLIGLLRSFSDGCERWVSVIGRLQFGRHGRTGVRSGSSDRSGGIALTMSLCLASGTFVTCSRRIKDIATIPARIYHWRRMRRSHARSWPSVKRWRCRSWADFTISMFGRKFPTGTPAIAQCPLLAQSGHAEACCRMSAFGGKADIDNGIVLCPLLTQSGHQARFRFGENAAFISALAFQGRLARYTSSCAREVCGSPECQLCSVSATITAS